jgi:lipopolysaccharide/colanic/teichoic acid biosynthesis glycosyltransferase
MIKRIFDLILASVGLVILLPLLAVVAVLIVVTSGRPVIYRGVRVGRFGRRFRIFKFRTMVVDAGRLGGTTTGLDDQRVTPFGAFLRRTKIDELPQVLNVIVGDMSLVGPRPEVPEYADEYDEDEKIILSVRPGITDIASLRFIDLQSHVGNGDPNKVYRERVLPIKNQYRMEYVRNRSFWGDVGILLRTVPRLIGHLCRRHGA